MTKSEKKCALSQNWFAFSISRNLHFLILFIPQAVFPTNMVSQNTIYYFNNFLKLKLIYILTSISHSSKYLKIIIYHLSSLHGVYASDWH